MPIRSGRHHPLVHEHRVRDPAASPGGARPPVSAATAAQGTPADLAERLPLCASVAEQALAWPLSLAFLTGGLAVIACAPDDNVVVHGAGYVVMVWGLTGLTERFVWRGRTCALDDGLHLRDPFGRRSVVAWADVLQVRPARTSAGRTVVRLQGRPRRRVLWGLSGTPARLLADAVAQQAATQAPTRTPTQTPTRTAEQPSGRVRR